MPYGDGKGPPGGRAGRGARMSGNHPGSGPGGCCICPNCGENVEHAKGNPCFHQTCPKCGTKMIRGRQ